MSQEYSFGNVHPAGNIQKTLKLLGNNNLPPSESETLEIKSAINERLSDVEAYDSQIRLLKIKVRELEAEINSKEESRSKSRSQLRHLKAILSPMRGVPPEVLAKIFYFCLKPPIVPQISQAPLLLCRICRKWRDVALTSPELWVSLKVIVKPKEVPQVYTAMWDFWFNKGGGLPRSLEIHADSPSEATKKVLSFLPESYSRLRVLHIVGKDFPSIHRPPFNFPTMVAGNAPLLEELHIDITSPSKMDPPVVNLETASRLHKVYFRIPVSPLYCPSLPWAQLTWLDIRNTISLSSFHTAMKGAPLLEHGRFLVRFTAADLDYQVTPLRNNNLTTLIIAVRSFPEFVINKLLGNTRFPAMQRFQLSAVPSPRVISTISYPVWSTTLSSSLETLVLTILDFKMDILADLLSGLPTLQRLGLYGEYRLDPISKLFMLNQGQPDRMPSLTHLFLCTRVPDIYDFAALENFTTMVLSRGSKKKGHGLGFTWLYFLDAPYVDEDLKQALEDVEEDIEDCESCNVNITAKAISREDQVMHITEKWYT